MKRLLILFAIALIALPSSAQRRVSKRSSDNNRKEAHRQVKTRENTSRRNVSRSVSRNSNSGSNREGVVKNYNKKSSTNRVVARNSFYDRSYKRRSYGKSHGHINHFHRGRNLVRNHYYVYNRPHHHVVFMHSWFNFYVNYFPGYRIHYSRHIDVIPGDIARYHVGDLKVVYGRVYETYYDPQVNEFYLYFGSPYPRQDLTVVVTGRDARRLARKTARYFIGWDFSVAGLITSWEGKPEIVINDKDQLQRF